jgi:NAD(P)-dependent dehydrogenase (short-subunit alcohol dehydrogenase family)
MLGRKTMARELEGRVTLVTGGAAGIGRAAALAFAESGATVAICDLKVDRGRELVTLIESRGGHAIFLEADVSRPADVDKLVADTVSAYGRLDCAFNKRRRSRELLRGRKPEPGGTAHVGAALRVGAGA